MFCRMLEELRRNEVIRTQQIQEESIPSELNLNCNPDCETCLELQPLKSEDDLRINIPQTPGMFMFIK